MPVLNTAKAAYLGTVPVKAIYRGTVKVWPSTPAWPTGLIIHHAGNTAPPGWAKCDGVTVHGSAALKAIIGTDTTPNLTDMFVRTTSGGANTTTLTAANLPQHAHSMGNDSATHTHVGTSWSGWMSANNTHTHTATLGDNDTQHYHNIPASNTGTVSAWHQHDSLIFNEGDGGDGDGTWVDQSPTNDGYTKDVGDTANPSANHYHVLPASTTGNINVGHTHGATTPAADPAHGHTFNATTTGTHTHVINAEGGGAAFSVIPEHYSLIYIIRL